MKSCLNCGSEMAEEQDWCLRCGAAAEQRAPGRPGWRSAALAVSASAVLALGAAAAAYAALNEKQESPPPAAQTVAQTPVAPPTGTIPTTPTTPTTPETPEAPPSGTGGTLPETPGAPPSLPKGPSAAEEKAEQETVKELEEEEQHSREQGEGKGQAEGKEQGQASEEGETEEEPAPMLLDTNAARVYNPYSYPEATFNDPSLAIDGEATTAFVVKVREESAPNMAAGLLIDMKALTKVEKIALITNTPGFTLQVYGTTAKKDPPESITSKGWVKLTKSDVAKKHKTTVTLGKANKEFRQILIWLVKAPEGSTQEAPGHVSINELQLFEKSG